MEIGAFLTGFNQDNMNRPKPGATMENDYFKVTYVGVLINEQKDTVCEILESDYDWTKVMEIVLNATKDYSSMPDVVSKIEEALRCYLISFQGWGLLQGLIPSQESIIFNKCLVAFAWDDEAMGSPSTAENIFDKVHGTYLRNCLRHLVPPFRASLAQIYQEKVGDDVERRKSLSVFFYAADGWMLEISFVIEKKRVNASLIDLAAEAVALQIKTDGDIINLGIPVTLIENVNDKLKDVQWVCTCRNVNTSLLSEQAEESLEKLAQVSGKLNIIVDKNTSDHYINGKLK